MCAEGDYFRPRPTPSLLLAAFAAIQREPVALFTLLPLAYAPRRDVVDVCYAVNPAPFGETHRRRINRLRAERAARRRR